MRHSFTHKVESINHFKQGLLHWSASFEKMSYLNSNVIDSANQASFIKPTYDFLVAVGAVEELCVDSGSAFNKLKGFIEGSNDWLFGYFSYDLKNETEAIHSENEDSLGFPELHFFRPRYVFSLTNHVLTVFYLSEWDTEADIAQLIEKIISYPRSTNSAVKAKPNIQAKVDRAVYLRNVQEIKKHIQRGDVYELNYCVEFFAARNPIDPIALYEALNALSQTPFSCFYRKEQHFLMCASPERFIKKEGSKLISQPIKGTRKRGKNELEDDALKAELFNDPKERSENVMIVDLVRNDLSRSAKRGSVQVEELFGVYTFKQVHQLISTISCELKESVHFVDAIKNAFPMGSMTGAPKLRAMQLIEAFENSKRGLYSGAVGYISPEGDFDFNVVIRSIQYNAQSQYTSFMVGSAITSNSEADQEYEECLVKADALFQVLNGGA